MTRKCSGSIFASENFLPFPNRLSNYHELDTMSSYSVLVFEAQISNGILDYVVWTGIILIGDLPETAVNDTCTQYANIYRYSAMEMFWWRSKGSYDARTVAVHIKLC